MDPESPLVKGRRLLEAGDYPGARAEFEKALAEDPTNAENYNSLGLVALREGKLTPDAEGYFRKAIAANSSDSAYTFNLGLTLLRQNRMDDAEVQFRQSQQQNPDYLPAHWGLANVFFNQRKWAESRQEYERIYAEAKTDSEINNQLGRIALAEGKNEAAEAYFRTAWANGESDWTYPCNLGLALKNQGRFADAVEAFTKSLQIKDEAYTRLGLAESLFNLGRHAEAKVEFERLLAADPANDQLENWLGRIGLATGNLEDAERLFRSAAERNKDEPAYPTNLALARLRQGDSADAERRLSEVVAAHPDYYPAQIDLGMLYFEQNAFDKAKIQFESALPKVKERTGNVQNWLGRVSLALNDVGKAEGYFRAAADINPKEPAYPANLGLALTRERKVPEAKAVYQRALAIDTRYGLAHIGLGSIYFDEGDYEEAKVEFAKALDGDRKNPELHNWLGRVALAQANGTDDIEVKRAFYAEAETAYLAALGLDGTSYAARTGLGSVYFDQAQYRKAREEFAQALKGNPNDAEAHQWLARIALAEENYALAEMEFARCIELDPKQKLASARLFLGTLFSEQERYKEARACLEDAVKMDPRNAEGYYELGRLFFRQKKYLRALEHQTKANGMNPGRLREEREIALTLIELERFEAAEKRLRALIAPKRVSEAERRSEASRIVNQTLADLYFRWGKAVGDNQFYDAGLEALDRASDATKEEDRRVRGQILCMRGIINCHRKQYAAATRDFAKSVECFEAAHKGAGGSGFDPTYYVARRNQARLRESFALVSGIDPFTLKWLSISLAIFSALQLVLLWVLFLGRWTGLSPKLFATLNPVFFGMILLSLLLPQLSKFKLGGITAEVAKPEQIEGSKTDWEVPRPPDLGYEPRTLKAGAGAAQFDSRSKNPASEDTNQIKEHPGEIGGG
jgi:tetratricopeptide (TPR) repeat protein